MIKQLAFVLGIMLLITGCAGTRDLTGEYVYRHYPAADECWLKLNADKTFSYGCFNPNICYMGIPSPISKGFYTINKDSIILDFIRAEPFVSCFDRDSNYYVVDTDGLTEIKTIRVLNCDTIYSGSRNREVLFMQWGAIYAAKTRSNYLYEFAKQGSGIGIVELENQFWKNWMMEQSNTRP